MMGDDEFLRTLWFFCRFLNFFLGGWFHIQSRKHKNQDRRHQNSICDVYGLIGKQLHAIRVHSFIKLLLCYQRQKVKHFFKRNKIVLILNLKSLKKDSLTQESIGHDVLIQVSLVMILVRRPTSLRVKNLSSDSSSVFYGQVIT